MEKIVYIVESGEYEQRGADVACATEALARDAVAKGIGDDYERLALIQTEPRAMRSHTIAGRLTDDYAFSGTPRLSLLEGPGISRESWDSWDFAVPTAHITIGKWTARGKVPNHVLVVGRDEQACYELAVLHLRILSANYCRSWLGGDPTHRGHMP